MTRFAYAMFHVEHLKIPDLSQASGCMSTPQPPKSKSRLGRGLSSLISVSDLPIEAETGDPNQPIIAPPFSTHPVADRHAFEAPLARTPSEIPVAAIAPNPHQPRKQFDE